MGKRIEYKVVSYVILDGQPHDFDKLDEETRSECTRKMLDNMGRTLSNYYSTHPEEVPALIDQPFVKVAR